MYYSRTSELKVPGSDADVWMTVAMSESGPDRAEDSLSIGVSHGDGPESTYHVYRDGLGWEQLEPALRAGSQAMHAAYDWWQGARDTPAVAGYQMLAAVDGYGACKPDDLATELDLPDDAALDQGRTGRTLQTLQEQDLITIDDQGRYRASSAADRILRPAGDTSALTAFVAAMNAAASAPTAAATPAAQAFPRLHAVSEASVVSAAATPAATLSAARHAPGR